MHVYHHDGDGCGSLVGGLIVLAAIGWLIYVVPGWVWVVLFFILVLGAFTKK